MKLNCLTYSALNSPGEFFTCLYKESAKLCQYLFRIYIVFYNVSVITNFYIAITLLIDNHKAIGMEWYKHKKKKLRKRLPGGGESHSQPLFHNVNVLYVETH